MKFDAAITLSISLIQAGLKISQMARDAAAANQTELSTDNWTQILADDATARKQLQDAIDQT